MNCVAERVVADVTVLDLSGQRMLGGMNTEVTDKIRSLIGDSRTKFLLNLQGVSYLDSSGLGDLAEAHQTAVRRGAKLKLSNVQERVALLLRTVNLLKVFEIFESEEEALKSFRTPKS
jgi:anti-sigma B factor antagonist